MHHFEVGRPLLMRIVWGGRHPTLLVRIGSLFEDALLISLRVGLLWMWGWACVRRGRTAGCGSGAGVRSEFGLGWLSSFTEDLYDPKLAASMKGATKPQTASIPPKKGAGGGETGSSSAAATGGSSTTGTSSSSQAQGASTPPPTQPAPQTASQSLQIFKEKLAKLAQAQEKMDANAGEATGAVAA